MQGLSNHIKSILYLGDINELGSIVERRQCITLQHFDYSFGRMLDDSDRVTTFTNNSIMNLVAKVQPDDMATNIYSAYQQHSKIRFTVIFNGTFDQSNQLSHYDSAIVVEGYITILGETFERAISESDMTSRAMMNIKIMMQGMEYMNKNNSMRIEI